MKKILAIMSSFVLCSAPVSSYVLSCSADKPKNLGDIDFSQLSKIHFQNNVMATVNYINGEIQKIIDNNKKGAVINLDFTTNVAQVVNHSPDLNQDAFTIKVAAIETSTLIKGSKEFKMEIPPVTFRKANFDLANSTGYSINYSDYFNGVDYIGTAANGLFYSIDHSNYYHVDGVPVDIRIENITMINDIVYVSTSDSFYSASTDGTIFTKYNFQRDGSTIDPTSVKPSIYFIKQVGPKHLIYAYTSWGLYYSEDNAKSFNWIDGVTTNALKVDLFESGPNIVMISRKGVFYASDGIIFKKSLNVTTGVLLGQISDSNSIFLRTYGMGLMISHDNGESFTNYTTTGFAANEYIRTMAYIHGTIFLGSSQNGLWSKSIGEDDFTQSSSVDSSSTVYHITEVKEKLYIGTNVGLYTSDDNGTTAECNSNIIDNAPDEQTANEISTLFAGEFNGIIFVGTLNKGLWYSYSDQSTFVKSTTIPADSTVVSIIPEGDVVYAYVYQDKKYQLYTTNW